MAPEQIVDAAAIGEATDIWAAAAVYYEMLTGEVPYPRKGSLQAALLARTRDDPVPIADVADIPRDIGRAVMRALNREPDRRFATSAEFAEVVERAGVKAWGEDWLNSSRTPVYRAAPRTPSGGAPTTGVVRSPGPRTRDRIRRRGRRRNVLLAAASVACVAAGVAVGVTALTGNSTDDVAGGTGGGERWGSWIRADRLIPEGPLRTPRLGAVPAGWGNRVAVGINLDEKRLPYIAAHFAPGVAAEISFSGDPVGGPSWDFHRRSPDPAAQKITTLESEGAQPYVNYYVLRDLGRGVGNDASEQDVLKQLTAAPKMKIYWTDVTHFLQQLGSLHQALPVDVEFGVSSTVEALVGDARKAKAVIASSGDRDLAGLPNTFAGWAQAWVRLRNKYAPKVMLGLPVDPWAAGDYLVPWKGDVYKNADVVAWAHNFGEYYKTLGTRFDFINYVVAVGEAGRLTTPDGDYYAHKADFDRLVTWVRGISQQAHIRVVLESVPVGNTIMAPENNTRFHWQDVYAQWLLGDNSYRHLVRMRDAGVIGIVFGFGYANKDVTCPCDAANDGETQGVGPTATPTGELAKSSDDDGGYLHDRIDAYLGRGGMSLR
jgi:hypothetical protein